MKDITVWERYNEAHKDWEHNHIEDGHTESNTPKSHTKDQARGWTGAEWKPTHAHLDDDSVVVE